MVGRERFNSTTNEASNTWKGSDRVAWSDPFLFWAGEVQIRTSGRGEGLSDRELEVFEMIGEDKLHLSVKTVESYREQIKIKLKVSTASELTHYAVEWSRNQDR